MLLFLLCLCTTIAAAVLKIELDSNSAQDAHSLLKVVLPSLPLLVINPVSANHVPATDDIFPVHFSLSTSWRANAGTSAAEDCDRKQTLQTDASSHPQRRVNITCGGLLGLAYSLSELHEALALNDDSSSNASTINMVISKFVAVKPRSVWGGGFSVRAWSEEGTLLAIPDRGYYTPDGGSADIAAIASEAAALEAEIIPNMLRLRMNTLIVLHSDVEDYITYDTLPTFLPNAPQVYSMNDTHRVRRAGIISVMAPWIAHLRDAYGITFFLQVYELSSPPGVCTSSPSNGAPALFNCSLDEPATMALLQTKYSELSSALPALGGIFVTVEDSWSPRAGYVFNVLWNEQAQLPRVVTMFYNAVVKTASLQMYFRLWLFGEPVDWPALRDNTPADTRFSIKVTNGDFLLDYPINKLLECENTTTSSCAPSDRRIIVEVDAFRQYNGWTSGVAWMGSQWAPRLAIAEANANHTPIDVWGWGSWAPGCTWPDSGPTLHNATPGTFKSWRSWWGTYRLFNATSTNGGFSLGGQANAYLLSRLSWDVAPANDTQIALDFGTIFYGAVNAVPIARLLNASFSAWLATSSPHALGDFTLFWTMMEHDNGSFEKLANTFSIKDFDAAAEASAAAVAEMVEALSLISPAAVPEAYPYAYAGAVRAVGITRGYLAAMFSWRSAGLAVAQLGKKPSVSACAYVKAKLIELSTSTQLFGENFPIEAAQWTVSTLDPGLYSHPPFLDSTERTMAGFITPWTAQVNGVC